MATPHTETMTAADLAATVRRVRFIGSRSECAAAVVALDTLQAQAEERDRLAAQVDSLRSWIKANQDYKRAERLREEYDQQRQLGLKYAAQEQRKIDRLAARVTELKAACPLCTHEWKRHDPEDGKCDAPAEGRYGACPCGRDPAFHRVRNASLSKLALDDGSIARAALTE